VRKHFVVILGQLRHVMHALAIGVVAAAAGAALAMTLAASLGWAPWLSLMVAYGEGPATDAGPLVQSALAVILLSVALVLPASGRVLRLEMSHRRFAVGMEDVARAYHMAHADDRRGLFKMRTEFDAIRERLAHLRAHPDLGGLEPDVLEVAAQMSVQSRRLAETYSDDKVARARRFLQERQEEVERTRETLGKAHHVARELRRIAEAVDLEESAVQSQRERLEAELRDLLERPEPEPEGPPAPNVVRMAGGKD
jgi:hypothetical protein